MLAYFTKYTKNNFQELLKLDSKWKDPNTDMETIKKIPSIFELINSPYILTIIAEVLPEIASK